ncbi:MAG: tRNA uridine-5-carboxymethylaminomethyl(34) synthesis GTPase MnmE, partial [Bacteroidetes bacterium]|nr:tRNA uridine-5-carboxymethylaminomethyl(34) synthesis GTPase MnmE [Bacteroidota bacterium]
MNPDLIHNIDTIVALATPPGTSAIAVIRVSGEKAIDICNQVFVGKDLGQQSTHTIHHGHISDGKKTIDEVLVSIFVAPHSYTKDNSVEISCHGSNFVIQQIIQLLLKKGARLAQPGEFTKRAFLNGQFDLAQAEAVADIIASDSEASHQAAMNQMRGG